MSFFFFLWVVFWEDYNLKLKLFQINNSLQISTVFILYNNKIVLLFAYYFNLWLLFTINMAVFYIFFFFKMAYMFFLFLIFILSLNFILFMNIHMYKTLSLFFFSFLFSIYMHLFILIVFSFFLFLAHTS